jgi:uncharacterized protein (TIGR02391 family)
MSLFFTDTQLEAIARALGNTTEGLTGSEIAFLLTASKIEDKDPTATKRIRLYNAFAADQNKRQNRQHILAFIRKSMKPERYLVDPSRFESMRLSLNQALLFAGLAVDQSGALDEVNRVQTILEAKKRANDLRADMVKRGVHDDVLKFCREELLVDNYFHAVLEAVKSVMDKLRNKSGISEDGAVLIDKALAGDWPKVRINAMSSDSERSEQKGFANLLRGIASMFRNTTAHEARIHWTISKDDAEDLLSMVSLVHRRLDNANT